MARQAQTVLDPISPLETCQVDRFQEYFEKKRKKKVTDFRNWFPRFSFLEFFNFQKMLKIFTPPLPAAKNIFLYNFLYEI